MNVGSKDKERLVIINKFELDGGERVNKLKLLYLDDFVQVYVNAGKTVDGYDKTAGMRLYKKDLKRLREWLDSVELKQ